MATTAARRAADLATTTLTGTVRRATRRPRLGSSARLRLTPYFLVLALPLAIGLWAFGNFAAQNARDRADTHLRASLTGAVAAYRREVNGATREARALANSPPIQRAVRAHDRQKLAAFARRHPQVAFFAGGHRLAGSIAPGAPTRIVRIMNGRRVVGSVADSIVMDEALLSRLSAASSLTRDQELVALAGDRVAAGGPVGAHAAGDADPRGDLRLGDSNYRAASKQVVEGGNLRLAAVERREVVSAAEHDSRRKVLLAGLAILGGVALAAYALAPTFARTRFAQAQRAQAAQVLSHVGDGVFLVDRTGSIGFWNPGAEALTGLPADAAMRRKPEELFRGWRQHAPEPTPSAEKPVAETGRYEVNGNELWLSVSAMDSPVGTVYAFRDRTDEYRLEEARADFVATVSHELRTPLASIHGAARTLRSRDENLREGTRRDLLEIVVEQSERLAHLVDQVLLANQLSSNSAHVERRGFDALHVTRDAVEGLRQGLPPEIQLELRLPPSLPCVLGDPDRVRQVIVNLVENAAKYSPGGGRIDVIVTAEGEVVKFAVRDEGLGIPHTEQARIFEKFYRLDAGMRRGVGGSGLGLFISRELVELMGGRMWVRSMPGVGSTFTFELPLSEPAEVAV
jgi:two-component system, OmpR family, phosphate regulon sensor histidine kinase PhoR